MSTTNNSHRSFYLLDSPESSSPSLAQVGGKGRSLLDSTQAGFCVPGGFVLTVSFFEPWLTEIQSTREWKSFLQEPTREACDALKEYCRMKLKLTATQQKELDTAWKLAFGDSQDNNNTSEIFVAVRSSSPEEDLVGTSFAGGYETTLGVTRDSLLQALVTCFASCLDYRIVQYKRKVGKMPILNQPKIAVVVQQQLNSDVSGVAFSLNPSNNCFDEIVVSANFGLGESVVGGVVTPDTYTIDAITHSILSKQVADKEFAIWLNDEDAGGTIQEVNANPLKQALTDEQIVQVAELVSKVEAYRNGSPVDIEWAFQDGQLYLLQSRPITAYVPLFPEMLTQRGQEKKLYLDIIVMTQGFSEPMSVLGLDIWTRLMDAAKPSLTFLKGKDGILWNVNGRQYLNLSNLMKCPGGRPIVAKTFKVSDASLGRAIDSIDLSEYTPSSPLQGSWKFVWTSLGELFKMLPHMLTGLFRGEKALTKYQTYSQQLYDDILDEDYLKDIPFDETTDAVMDRFKGLFPLMGSIVAPLLSRARLGKMFKDNKETEQLLTSLCMDMDGNPTSEMGHMMVELASFPEIQETDTIDELTKKLENKTVSVDFVNALCEYNVKFGCRGMKEIDVATPRTSERQEDLFHQLKQIDIHDNAIKSVTERREEAYAQLLEMANEMGKGDKFKYHANVIQKMGGYREHPKYLFVCAVAMLRRRALDLGRRFVEEVRLEHANQVFCLTIDQLAVAERNDGMELMPLVEKSTEAYEKVENVKNWPVLIDSRGKIIRAARKQDDVEEGCLLGDPISPGVVTGRAKVLKEPYEKPLESGEILIAKFTEPSWTPIFINCAAVVMEVGGVIQHGAIIAREYGIPCVSGIDHATDMIKDGDLLEVDGSDGIVKIVTADSGGAPKGRM